MKTNYQKETEKIIKNLTNRPKLLLHTCCAPCASYVIEYLSQYFELSLFFYNPNIKPEEEYYKRLDNLKILLSKMKPPHTTLIVPDYDTQTFNRIAKGKLLLPEGGERCTDCFNLRLSKSAEYAKKHDFDYYCTTLTISPHKNAELLNNIGNHYGISHNIKWLPSDFKKLDGYKRSIELSNQYGIYRQNYCGCTPNHSEYNQE